MESTSSHISISSESTSDDSVFYSDASCETSPVPLGPKQRTYGCGDYRAIIDENMSDGHVPSTSKTTLHVPSKRTNTGLTTKDGISETPIQTPITIKTFSASLVTPPAKQPTVEPITLKLPKPKLIPTNISRGHKNNKSIPTIRLPTYLSNKIASQSAIGQPQEQDREEDSESNESNENEPQSTDSRERDCDSDDCEIEWFHFECVGIMVPPKGQWFCPDCRKKKQRKELMETYQHS